MKKILILMFSCALILASCAGPKSATDKKSMLKDIDKKDKLVYQEMKAKLKINFPDLKNTADAVIKLQNSDTLAIDIFGPFGVKFGKLWADKNNFIFLNYFQSVVFTGTPSAENFKTAAMIDLSFDDLTAMMRAEPIADFSEYSMIEENEANTLFGRKVGNIAEFIIVDNISEKITQYQRQNENKVTVLNVFLEDYQYSGEFSLPNKIVANLPEQNASLTFEIKERTVNAVPAGLEKPIAPSSFKIIDVDSVN